MTTKAIKPPKQSTRVPRCLKCKTKLVEQKPGYLVCPKCSTSDVTWNAPDWTDGVTK
jgi:Zn finger protein HypA/HybF involved in hydrogenase expression